MIRIIENILNLDVLDLFQYLKSLTVIVSNPTNFNS